MLIFFFSFPDVEDPFQVSGADRAQDEDSGYVSWDPALGCYVSGVAASSTEFVAPDEFASVHEHDEYGYIPGYDNDNSVFLGAGGPLTATEGFPLGLTNPDLGDEEDGTLGGFFSDFPHDVQH